jgi:hypothetical protein
MSAAFLSGVIDGLGPEFVPLLHKTDIIGAYFSYLVVVFFFAGLFRATGLIFANKHKEWMERRRKWEASGKFREMDFDVRHVPMVSNVGSFVCMVGLVVLFLVYMTPAYSAIILLCTFAAIVLVLLFVYLYSSGKAAISFLFWLQLAFLLLMFATGKLWIEVQRTKPAITQLHLQGGSVVTGSVVFASSSGVIFFAEGVVQPEYYPWERLEKVSLVASEKEREPPFSEKVVRNAAHTACVIKKFFGVACAE